MHTCCFTKKTIQFLVIVVLVLLAFGAWGAEAPIRSEPGKEFITMNFKDVELQVLIKFMSELTGKNFLVDPGVKGFVTIHCPGKVDVDEAYKVFLSVLDVHGFTVVESGKVIKIIPTSAAKTKGMDILRERNPGSSAEKMVTQLVKLKMANSVDLAKVLAPLVEKTGLLIPYPETNTLIMIDMFSNVDRLVKIVQNLDVSGGKVIQAFPLKYAKAEDLGKRLQAFFQEEKTRKDSDIPVRIMADERTNSIVVQTEQKAMANIQALMESLDQEVHRPRENVHVYPLKFAVAEQLAKVLTELPGKGGKEDSKDTAQPPLPAPLSKSVQISADKASNTLIIVAEPEQYEILKGIIGSLDLPRAMVYVEALIVEVSASKALDLGVEWRVGNEFNGGFGNNSGGLWFGGSTSAGANIDAFSATGALPPGFAAGVIGKGIKLGSVLFPTIGAFVKAVKSDTDFNIISTPQILTLDNEEASIEVAQNIPFVTRVDQPVQTTERAIQSFDYKNVGVSLKVKPQINHDRFVRLAIEENVKSILSQTALGGTVLAPTTNVRTAKATISVRDGETVVLGGLIENRLNRGQDMTPCLGDIPFLGWLFKAVSDKDEKTNLLVFLTPSVVWSREEARGLYEKKKEASDKDVGKAQEKTQGDAFRQMWREK